ncbi:Protein LAZ1 homolog 2 [Linum perenne]
MSSSVPFVPSDEGGEADKQRETEQNQCQWNPFIWFKRSSAAELHTEICTNLHLLPAEALFLLQFLCLFFLSSNTSDPTPIHQFEQKWIVAVLFMVPVYATESLLSLLNYRLSLACDILRNCYEAFALYSFGSYLIACLAQMILKTLCAFLAFVLEIFGVYGDGRFKVYYGYPYMAVVLNFSQMWALYCLVQFYNVTHERLKPIKPLAKFISFKAIVFATWWQGVGIALLCSFEALPNDPKFRTGLQDFLICIEMAIAAITHAYVFPADPYQYVPDHPKNGNLKAAIDRRSSSSKEKLNLGGSGNKEGVVEKKETRVEAAGTSVSESVQDIVVQGGQHVVKDVVLTINQAMGPVEKGVTKIHQTFHRRSMSSGVEEGAEGEAEIVLEK